MNTRFHDLESAIESIGSLSRKTNGHKHLRVCYSISRTPGREWIAGQFKGFYLRPDVQADSGYLAELRLEALGDSHDTAINVFKIEEVEPWPPCEK